MYTPYLIPLLALACTVTFMALAHSYLARKILESTLPEYSEELNNPHVEKLLKENGVSKSRFYNAITKELLNAENSFYGCDIGVGKKGVIKSKIYGDRQITQLENPIVRIRYNKPGTHKAEITRWYEGI